MHDRATVTIRVAGPTRVRRAGFFVGAIAIGVAARYALGGMNPVTAPEVAAIFIAACALLAGISTLWSP